MLHHPHIRKRRSLYTLLSIGFLFGLHVTLPMYTNSSFLETITNENVIGWLYTAGALLTILGFLIVPHVVERLGNYKTSIILLMVQILLMFGLATVHNPQVIMLLFVLSAASTSLVMFTIDVFLESKTSIGDTGRVRGLFLTVVNSAYLLAPMFAGSLAKDGNYQGIFALAFGLLIPLLYIIHANFDHYKDAAYSHAKFLTTLRHVIHNKDLRAIFSANLILHTFYAWMIVYTPIYLNVNLGMSWENIGIIFTIMLLPFVFVNFPLGKIADSKLGEKEIMSAGFFLMGISTCALAFITTPNVWLWAIGLLMTRIGAATAEIMIETYFFKKVPQQDAHVLGLFRITRPGAYIAAPGLTAIAFMFTDNYTYMFIGLGILVLFALRYTLSIKDTA